MLPRSSKRCPPEGLLPLLFFCVDGLPVGMLAAFCRFAAILSRRGAPAPPAYGGRPPCCVLSPCGRGDLPPVYPPSNTRVLMLLLGAGVGGTYILRTSPLGRISSLTAGLEVGSIFLSGFCSAFGFFSSFFSSFLFSAETCAGADSVAFCASSDGTGSLSAFASVSGALSSASALVSAAAAGSSCSFTASAGSSEEGDSSFAAGASGADSFSFASARSCTAEFSASSASLSSSARFASSSAKRTSRRLRTAAINAAALDFSEAMTDLSSASFPVLYAPSCFTASCVTSFLFSLIATS